MKEQPRFIKEFSKKESPAERSQVAGEIWQKRKENSQQKKETQEKVAEIKKLEETISDLSENGLSRLMNYFKLKSLREKLLGEKTDLEKKQEESSLPEEMEEPKRMLEKFYREQSQKWENSPYSKEDLEKYFSEENLASLSVDEYATLLKRFPQEMVTHVTRQGVRDHVGHMYHTAGADEYQDGFKKIVEDRKLRSPMGVQMIEGMKEEAVAKYLGLERFKTEEEAREYLKGIVNEKDQDVGGSYADRSAIHFAAEEVADAYYGSESGNEIFITYPSAHIASQYHFNGTLNRASGDYWNDQWVWANEEKGMDLNAGLVFIPKETMVDPKNGSRYELDAKGKPVVNEKYMQKMQEILDSPEIAESLDKLLGISGKMSSMGYAEETWNSNSYNGDAIAKLEPYLKSMGEKFGVQDKRLMQSILNYNTLFEFKMSQGEGMSASSQEFKKRINTSLKEYGIYFKEAENRVKSEEYWESYFSQHPEQKPSKIVYYEGVNPSKVLYEWKKSKGLGRKSGDWEGKLTENKVERKSSEATVGMERFKSIAEKVIADYYQK